MSYVVLLWFDSVWRLYGSFDEITREWSDGVAAEEFSSFLIHMGGRWQMFVLIFFQMEMVEMVSGNQKCYKGCCTTWSSLGAKLRIPFTARYFDIFDESNCFWLLLIWPSEVMFDGPVDALWIECLWSKSLLQMVGVSCFSYPFMQSTVRRDLIKIYDVDGTTKLQSQSCWC